MHVMKYMGSKRELLPNIRQCVQEMLPNGGGVLDLFAGTCSVGTSLKDHHTVHSNDIQTYSSVLARALIVSNRSAMEVNSSEVLDAVRSTADLNRQALEGYFPKTKQASDAFVALPKWKEGSRKKYLLWMKSLPNPLNSFRSPSTEMKKLAEMFEARRVNPKIFPYCQTSFIFPETYFSFSQCIEIDSIRFAIDMCFESASTEWAMAIAALLHAHSYCSSGTGHFAMFRDLEDLQSVTDVFSYRKRSVWKYFSNKFLELMEFHRHDPTKKHRASALSFETVLKDPMALRDIGLIYADPPYSFVHYSRFYHATESLVRYDYMLPEFKGRYRTDRHQSPFCQKKNVAKAFDSLFSLAAKARKHVLLSYSDTGMISLPEILKIIEAKGFTPEVRSLDYNHSTMGRKKHKSNLIQEYLILARL